MAEEKKKEEKKEEKVEAKKDTAGGEGMTVHEVAEAPSPTVAEAKEVPAAEIKEEAEVEMTAEQKKLTEQIEKMTVLELNELVKVLEKKFGVSAQATATAPAAGAGGDEASEEQDAFSIELKSSGDQKIAVIKIVKEVLGLGLKDAKDLVDGVPAILKEDVKKEEAEEIKKKIEEVGGAVELK